MLNLIVPLDQLQEPRQRTTFVLNVLIQSQLNLIETLRVLKNFYVRMQVTRFFRQGYTLIESGHSQVLAALSPDGRKLAVAVLNPANEPCRFRLDLSRFSLRRAAVKGWRTSATEDCRPLAAPELPAGEQWEYLAPAQSLTTFVVSAKRRGLVR